MFFADGGTIPTGRFIVPRVEVEPRSCSASGSPATARSSTYDAVDYVVPALEIIDARSQSIDPDTKRPRKVFDTIADNAANAGVVIGGRPVKPQDVDLRWVAAIMSRNGVVEETGVAAGVLNHPANGVAWLANRLARFDVALEPGQIVLGGSFTRSAAGRYVQRRLRPARDDPVLLRVR